jgi:hypothetical protein
VKVTMLLCDYAQEVAGKLYVLGGGWSIYHGTPVTLALAVKVAVPWDGANMPHNFAARLVTEDGENPRLPQPDGELAETPFQLEGQFEAGRPPGLPPGSDLDVLYAFNIAGIPLLPGRYEWSVEIDGEPLERIAFTVMAQ